MKGWIALLGGLILWLVHFALVYAIPSLDAIGAMSPSALDALHTLSTLVCLALAVALAIMSWRRVRRVAPESAFRERLSALGAAVAGVAILWQAAPGWLL
jgi:hypothetical protein